MSLKGASIALAVALAVMTVPVGLAQNNEPPRIEIPNNSENERLARELIETVLEESHAAQIFTELRRTIRQVYMPLVRDAVQGDLPGMPAPDAEMAEVMAKSLTFLHYVNRAGGELDVALSENREAMISDAAALLAKTSTAEQIRGVREILSLPAVRKSFDAFHAMSRLITAFTYEDSLSLYEFSAWAEGVGKNISLELPNGAPGKQPPVPSPKKVAKAQAIVNDLLRISQLDEMLADVKRFAREVYAETAPMSEQEREELRAQIDQWEFIYNLQKTMAISLAPSLLASSLTDEQLGTLHGFVLSPAVAKIFQVLRDAVNKCTAFTKDDILGAQRSIEEIERKNQAGERSPEEKDRISAAWQALASKWTEIITNRISPETRSGLERSLADLRAIGAPM
jgi:hypothetical protein